jgi:hypothetical protein
MNRGAGDVGSCIIDERCHSHNYNWYACVCVCVCVYVCVCGQWAGALHLYGGRDVPALTTSLPLGNPSQGLSPSSQKLVPADCAEEITFWRSNGQKGGPSRALWNAIRAQ